MGILFSFVNEIVDEQIVVEIQTLHKHLAIGNFNEAVEQVA